MPHFAYPLTWWAAALLAGAAGLAAWSAYAAGRRLSPGQRTILAALRGTALLVLLLALFRPVVDVVRRDPRGASVAVLVDQSRSMRIADLNGQRRIDAARSLLDQVLRPRLTARFHADLYGFGDAVTPADLARLGSANQRRSDLAGALRSVRDRYHDRPLAGIVVVSDGGTTGAEDGPAGDVPVFTVGIGGEPPDREVHSITANRIDWLGSAIGVEAVVSSRGLGSQPFDVKLMANDRVVETRRVTPTDGPIPVRWSVAADLAAPVVYTVDIPADGREVVRENNAASVLVEPPGRPRRVLLVEGAPGFEHTFLKRAIAVDPAVELDSAVRKGQNDRGQDAFFVQADPARAPSLLTGYPTTKAALYGYDAVVFGSVDWKMLTPDQIAMTADFVRERGGGLMVLGARSFASPGLAGSALEDALPLELRSGAPSIALTAATAGPGTGGDNKVRLTTEGRAHDAMKLASSAEESEREWAALPPLATTSLLGPPRPGASVLAVTTVQGATRPVVAVQRYGRGRTMFFAGEGAWRWQMLMPAGSDSLERFWRQQLRWLSAAAPDPVTILPIDDAQPGLASRVDVLALDDEHRPVTNATVTVRVSTADAEASQTLTATLEDRTTGRYSARLVPEAAGSAASGSAAGMPILLQAEARRGGQVVGTARRWILPGGHDPEFADPRLNERVLRRLAVGTGGRYLTPADASSLPDLLAEAGGRVATSQARDLWQHPAVFALLAGLLGAEWVLRRRWSLP